MYCHCILTPFGPPSPFLLVMDGPFILGFVTYVLHFSFVSFWALVLAVICMCKDDRSVGKHSCVAGASVQCISFITCYYMYIFFLLYPLLSVYDTVLP
jgi:hypothetical protein